MPGDADARVQLALPRACSLLPCCTPARSCPPHASACLVPHAAHPSSQSQVPRAAWQSCCGHPAGPRAGPPHAAPVPPTRLTDSDGHPCSRSAGWEPDRSHGGGCLHVFPRRWGAYKDGCCQTWGTPVLCRAVTPLQGSNGCRGLAPGRSQVFPTPQMFSCAV